jgi:hypothetical protein
VRCAAEPPRKWRRRTSAVEDAKVMKIVVAVIKPFKLDEVRDALTAVGVHGLVREKTRCRY